MIERPNPSPDICIYCYQPGCEYDTVTHAINCPQTTGLYPITELDIEQVTICPGCDEPFAMGDFYVHVPLEEDGSVEATCIVCAIINKD